MLLTKSRLKYFSDKTRTIFFGSRREGLVEKFTAERFCEEKKKKCLRKYFACMTDYLVTDKLRIIKIQISIA